VLTGTDPVRIFAASLFKYGLHPYVGKHNGSRLALQDEIVNDQVLEQECLDPLMYVVASTKHCNSSQLLYIITVLRRREYGCKKTDIWQVACRDLP
jgi:hypothetical protein